ncbi:MAG: class I SAM-dependent DNA methyltransferase [FCB group bacterium]|jgi:hypothetical protein|nr:class I SAM-dependent DNA methyltransferase [FCB group bacterium]
MGITSEVSGFIGRWQSAGAAERANYQMFLSELCDLLGVLRPDPAANDFSLNAYVFERAVTFHNGDGTTSAGRIDLYKRGCFVLEAKGVLKKDNDAWGNAMLRAKGQAEGYIRALPADEGRPPLLLVVDVGHSIELYSEFTRTGGMYVPFPDPRSHRVFLADLAKPEVLDTLRAVWTDPLSLDPARRSARVTREIAGRLAELAKSLEATGNDPQAVAQFLMRCLFTMFAEDVGLLGKGGFLGLLDSLRGSADHFVPLVEELWGKMKKGGYSTALREQVLRFNGGLFEDAHALPIGSAQLELLIDAAKADWRDVEPAIFGTLLERALDPVDRHKLGAHYTPRAYVERLVIPTVVEPLREEWAAAQTAAYTLVNQQKIKEARAEVEAFHKRLCEVRVLDPACGSGNFLYVTLEHLKRLEGEVLNTLRDLGESTDYFELQGVSVDPHQLLGIELNPRAAAIAELVLWIGYLQWHFRTRGEVTPPEPVIKNFHNIECRDAVLEWDREEPVLDNDGTPVTRWDGRTTKKHPVTGEDVPDDTARIPVMRYINPRKAEWPQADFVVGNPPFIGNKRMRFCLGDGYAEAVRTIHPDQSATCDFVMYWWTKAAELTRAGEVRRFGLITTNSITQSSNRSLIGAYINGQPPLSVLFAISDHPWVDSADGAAVRIAMTVCGSGRALGVLGVIVAEEAGQEGEVEVEFNRNTGAISEDLSLGATAGAALFLQANKKLCGQGIIVLGDGFLLNDSDVTRIHQDEPNSAVFVRRYLNGRDLMSTSRDLWILDLQSLSEAELKQHPMLYQRIYDRVRPLRLQMKDRARRERWWQFGRSNQEIRDACEGLRKYIVTCQIAKHRVFVFLSQDVLPDQRLVAFGMSDGFHLGILSSKLHLTWAFRTGSTLEDRPCYNPSYCFLTFPFPAATEAQQARIRELGEALDAHRKRQQALHPGLTMTDMYNVLEKLRSGEALSAKDKTIHEQGLVSVLKQIHDELDAAVFEAYGWPLTLSDEEILEKLVALNAARAEEERRGLVRWLRPEFQNPQGAAPVQAGLDVGEGALTAVKAKKAALPPFPAKLAEQAQAVRAALSAHGAPADAATIAARFKGARAARVGELLEALAGLGQARRLEDGRFS